MEDFSPTPAEVEETPIKRRRFLRGNFLSSWLEHRDEDDDDDEETEDSSVKPKKKVRAKSETETAERDWLPERWRDRFKTFFKGMVSIEMVPAAAATVEDEPEDTETADVVALEHTPQPEAITLPPEEQGLLAVSADAQLRYYGYELPDEADEEEEPEVEVDEVETDQPVEQYRVPSVAESQATQASVAEQRTGSTEPVGDVLQRRQTERLEKKVKKLKKKTKSLKREQEEFNSKQKEFAKDLDKQQKAQERFEKVTVPKMERDRQELHKRLETTPRTVKQEIPERRAVIPEAQQKPQVKSEYEPQLEKVETAPKPEQPTEPERQPAITEHEKLNRIFEAPAQETSLKESDLERRHEVKDEPGVDRDSGATTPSFTGPNQPIPNVPPPFTPSQPTGNIPPISTGPVPPPPKPSKPDNLYKQAAVTGAVSGIGLTIIVILILLLMRS